MDEPTKSKLYRVRTKQFCSLCKEQRWQAWLHTSAPNLFDDLIDHLSSNLSCRANHQKMVEIYQKLEARKLVEGMVKFLVKEYPYAVEDISIAMEQPRKVENSLTLDRLDNQDIFVIYKPNLLTFPQKLVLKNDDVNMLHRDVMSFINDKVGVDFVIIKNVAYIEFFKLKFQRESKQFPLEKREIYRYRMKHGLALDTYIVE